MNNYIIFCTEEQTKKALELGAPLEFIEEGKSVMGKYLYVPQKWGYYIIPTAEQMILWLEMHNCFKYITVMNPSLKNEQDMWVGLVYFTDNDKYPIAVETYSSRKEATLAAIDAALNYLINKKEK